MMEAADLHLAAIDAVTNRDFAALRDLYHDDYVYMSGDGIEQPGADAGVAVVEQYTKAFPDLTFIIRDHHQPSESVSIIEFRGRGTHSGPLGDIAATGKQIEVPVCNVIETKDGKIWREREYYDSMAMLTQLGVMEG
jgi:steroid delta-isomerase-like uncharacterized protein